MHDVLIYSGFVCFGTRKSINEPKKHEYGVEIFPSTVCLITHAPFKVPEQFHFHFIVTYVIFAIRIFFWLPRSNVFLAVIRKSTKQRPTTGIASTGGSSGSSA